MTYQDSSLSSDSSGEAQLGLHEIFFSRTDERGVIQAGNSVFRNISGFDWEELLDAPHKIVRHPDMPKGVFHLFWSRLSAGKPVGAYIKNRTKSGGHYWVFSVATPIEGGFVSVRIKPVGPMLNKVVALYQALVRQEAEGLSPADSHAALLEGLTELGFADYEQFQSLQLNEELNKRQAALELRPLPGLSQFRPILDAFDGIEKEIAEFSKIVEEIRAIPVNMRILAARLEDAGAPIDAIAINYGSMATEMSSWLKKFTKAESSATASIGRALQDMTFVTSIMFVQTEMLKVLRSGNQHLPQRIRQEHEEDVIGQISERFRAECMQHSATITEAADNFASGIKDMKRHVVGLSSTRMMCKSESAILGKSGEALVSIVSNLDNIQTQIEGRLAVITKLLNSVQNKMSGLNGLLNLVFSTDKAA